MPLSPELASIADERFVSLTTYRKSGVPVSTPVWIARDVESLLVTTPSKSGKVKRLRNDPRVEMRPCSRMGKVADDAPVVRGTARIVDDPATVERMGRIFLRKYRLEYRIFLWIESRGKNGKQPRVELVIA